MTDSLADFQEPEGASQDDPPLDDEISLSQHFNKLSRLGLQNLTLEQKSVFCDMEGTLALSSGFNIPLYRVLLKFREAGVNVVLFSDNPQRFSPDSTDIELFRRELERQGIDASLLETPVRDKSDYKGKKLGLHIDDNVATGHPESTGGRWKIESCTHWHPGVADGLRELQRLATEATWQMDVPAFVVQAPKLG